MCAGGGGGGGVEGRCLGIKCIGGRICFVEAEMFLKGS